MTNEAMSPVFAFVQIGVAAIVKGIGVVRTKLDRLIEVLNGGVVFAFVQVSVAAIVEGIDVVWIELDRLIAILQRAIILALVRISPTAIAEGDGEVIFRLLARLDDRGTAANAGINGSSVSVRAPKPY